jgi:hypothetical protein
MKTFKSFNEMYDSIKNNSSNGTTKKVKNRYTPVKVGYGGTYTVLAPAEPVCTVQRASEATAVDVDEDGNLYGTGYSIGLSIKEAGKKYAAEIKNLFAEKCNENGVEIVGDGVGKNGEVVVYVKSMDDGVAKDIAEEINRSLVIAHWGGSGQLFLGYGGD